MPNELKIVIDADVQKGITGIEKFSKVVSGEFNKAIGSVTDFEKSISTSISKINSSLTGLKVTSLDVNVNTSKIDAGIKTIQSKFAALVDPELNVLANTGLAEAKIKELLSELSTLKGSELFIRANDSQALKVINEVEAELNGILDKQINLRIDPTGVRETSKIISVDFVKAIEAGSKGAFNLEKSFAAATTRINSLVDNMVANALAEVNQLSVSFSTIKTPNVSGVLSFDSSKALAEIKNLKAEISSIVVKPISVPINIPPIPPNTIKSINDIERELAELQQKIDFSKDIQEIRKLGDEFKRLQTQLNNLRVVGGLDSKFEKIGASSKNAAQGLKQIPRASDQATLALSNLGRVVQDAPFGFLGIANNLNPLLESFDRLKKTSGTTGSALKAVAGSLLGAGGLGFAVSIASSLLITFGSRLFGAGKSAEAAKKEITEFDEAVNDAGKSFADSAVKATSLVAALSGNSLNLKERKAALEELKGINQQFFGSLKEEDGLIKGLQAAYDGYILRIKEVGKTKAIESQLTKLFDKKLQLELQIDPKFVANIDPSTQRQIGALKKELQSLGGAVDLTKEKFNAFNVTQSKRLSLQQKITQLESGANVRFIGDQFGFVAKEIENLELRINALSGLLKTDGKFDIKIPPPDTKAFDKLIDDTIATAKLAAKEFGETFVVPELEITFFKNKNAVFKDAKDFLGNVKSFLQGNVGALKIKLPVLTEFEFIPEGGGVSQETIDNFFSDLKLKAGIPIEVTPDLTLAKGNLDLIDKKLDLRKQFSILGDLGLKEFSKIDFSNINAGIAEATKRLQGMMEIATTLNQAIGQGLANSFNAVFDAILEGKNVFKALGQALKELVVNTIKAVAQMLILKAITSVILPGLNTPVPLRIPGISRGLVGSANLGGLSGIGSRAFNNVIQIVGQSSVSGDQIITVFNRASSSQGRFG